MTGHGIGLRREPATLIDLLRSRVDAKPTQLGYIFLKDGETDEQRLSYAELDQRARAIGALLQAHNLRNERALLLYPPGLDYIAAFFGCLYANVVAVPAYPPQSSRPMPRIQAIATDARAAVVLTTSGILSQIQDRLPHAPALAALPWLATDQVASGLEADWQPPSIRPETLAFLQYTSGSTSTPKGVMLSHGNLLANSALIHQAFDHSPESQGVIWLPPYHDMGLIGGIIQPLYAGFPVTLMSPVAFLQRPLRWLQAISRYRGTTSGGPNFAYDLCVRRSTPEQRAALDLSSWKVAFNGAEPIRSTTLAGFSDAFAASGFRSEAFYPCYGLAEATLIVTGGQSGRQPVVKSFVATALEQNQAVVAEPEQSGSRMLVSCGQPLGGQQVAIVDPHTMIACAPGQVGEIWVAGPSVAEGYWDHAQESERSFNARQVDTGAGPFLRTGDLGFWSDGGLFITGRTKELIIIRGRNHYPQDIELTVEQSHAALRPGSGAAFTIEAEGEEHLVVVHELDRRARNAELAPIRAAVRQSVSELHGLQVYVVALIKHGSLLKTSSGKIQRQAMRAAFLSGSLELVDSDLPEVASASEVESDHEALVSSNTRQHPLTPATELRTRAAALLRLNPEQVDIHQPLSALGLDSLGAIELQHIVEQQFAVVLPLTDLLGGASIAQLSAEIRDRIDSSTPDQIAPILTSEPIVESSLSYGQRALWFLQQLAPDNTAYHIASASRVGIALDVAALQRALQRLIERHAALRTTFGLSTSDQEPIQTIQPHGTADLSVIHATSWSQQEVQAYLNAEVDRPFDLMAGPLLRLRVLHRAADESILLLVVHHIIADFWSLTLLARELSALYAAECRMSTLHIEPAAVTMGNYVRWQAELLAGAEGQRQWAYWQQLSGHLPVLNLPIARPRPPVQTYAGAAHRVRLGTDLTGSLKSLSEQAGVTLYVTLLSAFNTLLHRYTGQDDILIGSPVAGRSRARLADLMGYLVNLVVLRTRLNDNPSFMALLGQVQQTVLEAFAHQDYPFALLAERVQPNRDPSRSPLVQIMFSLQKAPHASVEGLTGFAIGEAGVQIEIESLPLESLALEQRTAQFDLTLVMAEVAGELIASFQYNTDLLEEASVARMAEHFVTLLSGIVAQPEQPIAMLPLLTRAEIRQQLVDWNATQVEYPQQRCIHQLFEDQVARTPTAPALVFAGAELSYAELNQRVNQLAHYLQSLGIGPRQAVGICMERSVELMVGLLAILKAGAGYVPLDPTYPHERLKFVLDDAQVPVLLTQARLVERLPATSAHIVAVDRDCQAIEQQAIANPVSGVRATDLAYIIYTSGSTGRPKGVQLSHRGVINFFAGMDQRIGCDEHDTLLAVTSIAFDISVLELFWTLTRGARVVLLGEHAVAAASSQPEQRTPTQAMQFSLFYFASSSGDSTGDMYRLLLEGAKFADRHGFAAIWTPERHFHEFGGLYPNPAITSAALATITERIQLRGGSVVMPLHHPIRVAEEWAVVDNLSRGRVGIAFASGWHSDDFAFYPEHYQDRKQIMVDGIAAVQQLWRGEALTVSGGAGTPINVRLYPKPVQPTLPIWLTAGGSPETFKKAGELGANVLTHLLGQSIEDLAEKIALYKTSLAAHGHDPDSGKVTLMLHTFIDDDMEVVRSRVRVPFTNYLRSSVDLIHNLIKSMNLPLDLATMSAQDMDTLLGYAFDRYFETSALFGTPDTCQAMIDRLKQIGVDEVACLIDFGVEVEAALAGLTKINALREREQAAEQAALAAAAADYSLAAQARRYQATLLQCTPSMMRLLSLAPETMSALQSLRVLLLGGEALPPALAQQIKDTLPARLVNMYGPTETTIWSATYEVETISGSIPIGRPIANTRLYVLDRYLNPVPVGVPGELYIGGDGLALGYLNRAQLTAEKFVADPFSPDADARLYHTGDLARYLPDGKLDFLGRIDQQVKVRGYRIELEEIEIVLARHPAVREAVVAAREDTPGDVRLVAYVVENQEPRTQNLEDSTDPGSRSPGALGAWQPVLGSALREFLAQRLPEYMVPSAFVVMEAFPYTPNGKLDRQALPAPNTLAATDASRHSAQGSYVPPTSKLEHTISAIWRQALKLEQVSIHDNFFDLGGHSLLMAQVHSRIRDELKLELPLIKLMEYPTISALARYLGKFQVEQPSFQKSQDRAMKQIEGLRRHRQAIKPR